MTQLNYQTPIEPMESQAKHHNPINVLVVDDKAVMRSLLKRMLGDDEDINVVSSAVDERGALGQLNLHDVDVVLLDVHVDSMTIIPNLLAAKPRLKIVMIASASTQQGDLCINALKAGAVDYIAKPNGDGKAFATGSGNFQHDLLKKIKHWGGDNRLKRGPAPVPEKPKRGAAAKLLPLPVPKQIVLREGAIERPSVIAIGSSTGGPEALLNIIPHLKDVTQPIFITQHMPAAFTSVLAKHITECGSLPCVEAKDGMLVVGKTIYLAPGDYHMVTQRTGEKTITIRLNQNPPENFCRPAVDPMLRSLSELYGNKLFIAILTGMGSDGQKGAALAVQNGAAVIAQNEATSVVWGMPAAVAHAGLCHAVLPLNEIGPVLAHIAQKGQAA